MKETGPDPGGWSEHISAGAFARVDKNVPLTAEDGTVLGTAHARGTPEGLEVTMKIGPPSYHDLHVTTAEIPRSSIFNLPYGIEVSCCRATGWRLVIAHDDGTSDVLAGEYEGRDKWLVLDVAGHVIVDSRKQPGR